LSIPRNSAIAPFVTTKGVLSIQIAKDTPIDRQLISCQALTIIGKGVITIGVTLVLGNRSYSAYTTTPTARIRLMTSISKTQHITPTGGSGGGSGGGGGASGAAIVNASGGCGKLLLEITMLVMLMEPCRNQQTMTKNHYSCSGGEYSKCPHFIVVQLSDVS